MQATITGSNTVEILLYGRPHIAFIDRERVYYFESSALMSNQMDDQICYNQIAGAIRLILIVNHLVTLYQTTDSALQKTNEEWTKEQVFSLRV